MTDEAASAPREGLDFEALFRAAPAGTVVADANHLIVDVNDAFLSWTGLRKADVVGTPFMRLLTAPDRILFSTHSLPLLDLTGRVPETAVTILGPDRAALPASLTASSTGAAPGVTLFVVTPRRERSFEEEQLISAVHRAEDSDARRKEAEESLERQETHDTLTGLLNRTGLLTALSGILTRSFSGQGLAVYWIGLDHFRIINESLGRTAGDEILTIIAQRLRARYGGDDLVARVGGDEFIVAAAVRDHEEFAQDLLDLIAAPVTVEDLEMIISASIGIAAPDCSEPHRDAGDVRHLAEALLRNAGTGTYEAKAAGRNRWKRFTATPDESAINDIQLLGEIRAALASDQFRLEYQPQLDLHTGRLHGFEALIRWDHPERGLISPAGFIELAEKTGLIIQLDEWVCRTAIAKALELTGVAGAAPIQMSVNVSARQLGDPHFSGTIEDLLSTHAFDPSHLTIEITETGVITDAPLARANLESLHQQGVRVSVDDFGTGHAGFSYLYEFPIDEVKIDRSFVSRLDTSPEASAIVTSCIEVAHALGVVVVAEGVETAAHLDRLTELGCDIAQGFYYSRPLRAEALHAALNK